MGSTPKIFLNHKKAEEKKKSMKRFKREIWFNSFLFSSLLTLLGLTFLMGCTQQPAGIVLPTPTPAASPTASPTAIPSPTYQPPPPLPTPTPWAQACPEPAVYAATTGNDQTGDGSLANPYQSLTQASQATRPGVTICVRGGLYQGEQQRLENLSGTAEQPIVVQPFAGEEVIFDGTGLTLEPTESLLFINRASHVVVQGFVVQNSPARGISVYEGEFVTVRHNRVHTTHTRAIGGGGTHLLFEHNHIWNAVLENENHAYQGQGGWAGALATYGRADDTASTHITIRHNLIHDVWGEGIIALRTQYITVTHNTVYDAYSANIYVDKVENGKINSNYLYATTEKYNRPDKVHPAHGILLSNEGSTPQHPHIKNIVIANNLIVATGNGIGYWQYPYNPLDPDNTYQNLVIAHNVIVNTHWTAVEFDLVDGNLYHQPVEIQLVNNIIFAGQNGLALDIGNLDGWLISHNLWPSGYPDQVTNRRENWVAPAVFVAPHLGGPAAGFQLVPGSVLAQAGLAVPEIPADFWGTTRSTTNPTLGIYELVEP